MAGLFERDQVGKRQDLADVIANVEVESTPYASMIPKLKKPVNVQQTWQVESYKTVGHAGVLDGLDAENFDHTGRAELSGRSQKVWNNPGISDFASEAVVAGLRRGEMAHQIAVSIVNVKRIIEKRLLSNEESQADDGAVPNETRGIFKYIQATAQSHYAIDEDYRTPAAQIDADGALDTITEATFLAQTRSAFKERKGRGSWDGIVGIDLKAVFTDFSRYVPDKASHTVVRTINQDAMKNAVRLVVDLLELDTGTVRLHPSAFLRTDPDTGDDTDYTHRSGVFLDIKMCGLAYTRFPRVRKLEDKGGGPRAIVDAIFAHIVRNVLAMMKIECDADS